MSRAATVFCLFLLLCYVWCCLQKPSLFDPRTSRVGVWPQALTLLLLLLIHGACHSLSLPCSYTHARTHRLYEALLWRIRLQLPDFSETWNDGGTICVCFVDSEGQRILMPLWLHATAERGSGGLWEPHSSTQIRTPNLSLGVWVSKCQRVSFSIFSFQSGATSFKLPSPFPSDKTVIHWNYAHTVKQKREHYLF